MRLVQLLRHEERTTDQVVDRHEVQHRPEFRLLDDANTFMRCRLVAVHLLFRAANAAERATGPLHLANVEVDTSSQGFQLLVLVVGERAYELRDVPQEREINAWLCDILDVVGNGEDELEVIERHRDGGGEPPLVEDAVAVDVADEELSGVSEAASVGFGVLLATQEVFFKLGDVRPRVVIPNILFITMIYGHGWVWLLTKLWIQSQTEYAERKNGKYGP